MVQSKRNSLLEALLSTFIGLVVSLLAQMVLYPVYGITMSLSTNLQLLFWFTLIGVARSYAVRRFFEWMWRREWLR
jgi:hypothetical protein